MTARPGPKQTSWNQGEIPPESHGRTELKQWFSAAKQMLGVEPVPQGGFRLLPRSRKAGRLRSAMVSLTADDETTNFGPHSSPATLLTQSFATPQQVAIVTLYGMTADEELAEAIRVDWRHPDTGVWAPFAPVAFGIGAGSRVRIAARPPGEPVTASEIRIRLIVSPSSATFSFSSMLCQAETGAVAPVRIKPFTFSRTQAYVAVFTPFHVDLWRDGVFVGAVESDIWPDQVDAIVETQRFDTMLVFHQEVASARMRREGADHEWSWSTIPFEQIPEVDLGGSYSATADQWQIYIRYPTTGDDANGVGLYVAVSIDGEDAPAVSVPSGPDWATFAANLQAAIEGLPSIGSGITLGYTVGTGVTVVTITFTGTDNLGNTYALSARVVNSINSAATATHTVIGSKGGEPLTSPSMGYAACGGFYQDRLVTAGMKSKGGAILASVTGDYFNQNILIQAATGAILLNLDTDGAERIQRLARGRHLVIFTSDAEYFIADRQVQRGQPVNIVECSRNGSAQNVPIVTSEGSLIYVSANRSMLYAATYSDISQAYESEPISLLASHLVHGIRDQALQRGSEETDADRLFLPRDDGVMLVALLIRNQEVGAFVRWQTEGSVKCCCVDGANVATLAVHRQVDGQTVGFLERLEPELLLDCAQDVTLSPAQASVTGLADYEGEEVWAIADGFVEGPFTVEAGAITLGYVAEQVTVGRWTPPVMETLPPGRDVGPRIVLQRPGRIHTVRLQVIDTTSLAVGANGEAARDVTLYRSGMPTDVPLAPVTGLVCAEGLTGFVDEPTVVVTQKRPGRLQVREQVTEARL